MSLLSRLLLTLVVLAGGFCLAAFFVVTWPWSALAVLLGVAGRLTRRRIGMLTSGGTAEFADHDYLRARGMLGTGPGLVVGRLLRE
jgi:hypothetical protein